MLKRIKHLIPPKYLSKLEFYLVLRKPETYPPLCFEIHCTTQSPSKERRTKKSLCMLK